jgi:hypothetical protein
LIRLGAWFVPKFSHPSGHRGTIVEHIIRYLELEVVWHRIYLYPLHLVSFRDGKAFERHLWLPGPHRDIA